jgi:hypothetical protein
MTLVLKDVVSRRDMHEFIYLPEKIHSEHENWLPPIYRDEWNFFNSNKNPSFKFCDTRLILAQKDGRTVGRIMGIIHKKHNTLLSLNNVRFGYLDCFEDSEVFHALINAIISWGKEKNMHKLIGPYGFSDKDVQGFQISGFEEEPVIDSACNFPYLVDFMERSGFEKEADCVCSRYDLNSPLPEIYTLILQRVKSREKFEFLEFTSRRQLKPYIIPVFETVNDAFRHIYGFVPMDNNEMKTMAKQYMPIIDPRFVKVITFEKKVIGFIIGLPSLTKGIQKAKGRLFPFGIFHILRSMRTATKLDLMLGAIKPEFQKNGLDLFLSVSIIETAKKLNYSMVDTHLVLEENFPMKAEINRFGAKEVKRFRIYKKMI